MILRISNRTTSPLGLPAPYNMIKGQETLVVTTTVKDLEGARVALINLSDLGLISFVVENDGTSAAELDTQFTTAYDIGAGHQSSRIIVGNELAGDLGSVCDVLDPGDGTGIAIALAMAGVSAQKDIFVRSGTYTLLTALTIPSGVRLVGAGVGQTIIIGPSAAGVSMRVVAMVAGTATVLTQLSDMSIISPAPVAGVILPANNNYGLVQVANWCKFDNLDLTITGSPSVSHAQCVGFASHSNYGQVWGVAFTDCVVRSVSMTLNSVEVMGWWMDSVSNSPVPAIADVVLTRCTFYASGSEQTLYPTNSAHGFWFALDGVRLIDCSVFKSHGFAWEGTPIGALRGPIIQGLTVDTRGATIARTYNACMIIPAALVGGNSFDNINISGLRLYGDANTTSGSAVCWIGTSGVAPAALSVRALYVECASTCTVAGAGCISINGEANDLSGAVVIAQLGTTGDVDLVSVAPTGSTRDVSFHLVCRNISISNDTRYSQLRFVSPRVSGTWSIGLNAADVQIIGGRVATLSNSSLSTTIVDTYIESVGVINVKPVVTATPATPLAGQLTSYAGDFAGRTMAFVLGQDAVARPTQAFLGSTRIAMWNPAAVVTTAPGVIGINNSSVNDSCTWTARSVTATNFFTRVRRASFVGNAAAGRLAGMRFSVNIVSLGDGAGLGGFLFVGTFGCGDAATVAGARQWYGLTSNTGGPTNVEPSTLTNIIAVGHGTADTNLKLYYGGSSAQTPIDLGVNFPANTLQIDWYELALFSPSNQTGVCYYRVRRCNTGHVASGQLSNVSSVVLPQAATLLGFNCMRSNNATALACTLDLGQLYFETAD